MTLTRARPSEVHESKRRSGYAREVSRRRDPDRCDAGAGACGASPAPLFGPVGEPVDLDDPRDRQIFERMYRSISPRLQRFVRMAEPSEAEDIASEVWLAVTRYLSQFRGDADGFEALVFTIARRRISDHRRRRAFRRTDVVATLTDRAGHAETDRDAIDQLRTRATLEELFRVLPKPQAEVVVLRVVYGLSVERVAALVGRSPGNVRILQHRALKRLRAA